MSKPQEITKKAAEEIINKQHPTSLTQISKALGREGSISGSLTKKIKEWFPNIDEILKSGKGSKSTKAAKKSTEAKKTKEPKRKFTIHPANPFRPGSSYHACFNILGKFMKAGLHRKKLVELLARETGKDETRAGYDAAVLLSAKESNTGPRHRSCKEGFWVRRTNDHVQLVVD